jgi:hypothetical protein
MTSGPGVTTASIGGASVASGVQQIETPADGSWSGWYRQNTTLHVENVYDGPVVMQLYLNGKPSDEFLNGPTIDNSERWFGEHHTRKMVIFRLRSYKGKMATMTTTAIPFNPFEKMVRTVTPIDVP